MNSVQDLRIAAMAIYVAAQEEVADDVAEKLRWAANEIERLEILVADLKTKCIVPEGWKLVPEEPTKAMLTNGKLTPNLLDPCDDLTFKYKAMLECVPRIKTLE